MATDRKDSWAWRGMPSQLREKERRLIARRRLKAGLSREERRRPCLALSLSGGGIRSATFCLGVMQALAKKGLLKRVDYLSTVSGGGYAGSFLGALYHRVEPQVPPEDPSRPASSAEAVAAVLKEPSHPLSWLRDNGFYLAPNGAGDLLLMLSITLRNWVAVNLVLGCFALLGFLAAALLKWGALVALPEAAALWPEAGARFWWSPAFALPAVLMLVWALPAGWAYWLVQDRSAARSSWARPWITVLLLALGAAGALGWQFWQARGFDATAAGPACLLLAALLTFLAWGLAFLGAADQAGVARSRLSRALKGGLLACGILLLFALVDSFGQTLYAVFAAKQWHGVAGWASGAFAGLAFLALSARKLAAYLPKDRKGLKLPLSLLAYAAALPLAFALLTVVSVLSQGFVWGWAQPTGNPGLLLWRNAQAKPAQVTVKLEPAQVTVRAEGQPMRVAEAGLQSSVERELSVEMAEAPDTGGDAPRPRWEWLASGFGALLALGWLFGQTRSFLNASGMGFFYQARLIRAYLGASNLKRGPESSVRDEEPEDDLAFQAYAPQDFGGPLHLLNVTVNETKDGASNIEQRDRKGLRLTAGPAGLSLGVKHHALWSFRAGRDPQLEALAMPEAFQVFRGISDPEALRLGRWMGISGAAFSTGSGYHTTPAISFLCGLFNVRIGYWWQSGVDLRSRESEAVRKPSGPGFWLSRAFPVQTHLLDEWSGRFSGTARRQWYLSDGGHFENTAVYELVRRRVPLILLCDCGTDGDYTFEDLANLTLKARNDFDAELEFLSAEELRRHGLDGFVGPLEYLRRGRWSGDSLELDEGGYSRDRAALARIRYREAAPGAPQESLLLLLKPALTGTEPVDLLHYHAEHPDFPHESTLDQFFGEAQWEAYRKLGEITGLQLAPLVTRLLSPKLGGGLENL